MKHFAFLLLLAMLAGCHTKQQINQTTTDPRTGNEILIGHTTRSGMESGEFATWFDEQYNSYTPDYELIGSQISPLLDGTSITIVMGTWCSDSRREVPRFFHILDQAGYNETVKIINIDTDKKAPGTGVDQLNIERVPTFIFSRNGTEIGRIIETPEQTLEKDMLQILTE